MREIDLALQCERWQQRLGLAPWDIELRVQDASIPPLDANIRMRVHRHSAYQRAVIFVASHLVEGGPPAPEGYADLGMTDRRLITTLVHELLHLWTGRIVDPMTDDLDGMVHRDALVLFEASLGRAEEYVVDTLARALVIAFDDGLDP